MDLVFWGHFWGLVWDCMCVLRGYLGFVGVIEGFVLCNIRLIYAEIICILCLTVV